MCGIVGYVGSDEALPIVLEGGVLGVIEFFSRSLTSELT